MSRRRPSASRSCRRMAQAWRSILLVSGIALLPSIAYLSWQILLPVYIHDYDRPWPRGDATNISLIGVVVFLLLIVPSALLSDPRRASADDDRLLDRRAALGLPHVSRIPDFSANSYTGLCTSSPWWATSSSRRWPAASSPCMVEHSSTPGSAPAAMACPTRSASSSPAHTFPPIMTAAWPRSHDYSVAHALRRGDGADQPRRLLDHAGNARPAVDAAARHTKERSSWSTSRRQT